MPIQVKCPNCSKEYRLKDELAGKKIRCKECETSFQIPVPKKKKQAQAEEPEGSISNFDLAALNLAEEERQSRAYKKRQIEDDQKKVKKKKEYVDHDAADVLIGNVGKFAWLVMGVNLVSFGLLWFLSWMQSTGYIKFFWFVYRISAGLAVLLAVGAIIGSMIWFSAISLKENGKMFAGNLIGTLLSWLPVNALLAVGVCYLVQQTMGDGTSEDKVLEYAKDYLLGLGIAGGLGIGFPIYYMSTRWNRVSRSIYLVLIGAGIVAAIAATYALIFYQDMVPEGI